MGFRKYSVIEESSEMPDLAASVLESLVEFEMFQMSKLRLSAVLVLAMEHKNASFTTIALPLIDIEPGMDDAVLRSLDYDGVF